MSDHLHCRHLEDWTEALEAVQEIAAGTDGASSSRPHLDTMVRFVRDEPRLVVHLLTRV